jgi:hypothetical protein
MSEEKPTVALFEGDPQGSGMRFLGRTNNVRLVRLVRERIDKDKAKRKQWIEELEMLAGMTQQEALDLYRLKKADEARESMRREREAAE